MDSTEEMEKIIPQCFLCFDILPKKECKEGKTVEERTPLKMLLRHLNIDISKVASAGGINRVRFCVGCDDLMKDFWEWYQNLESVRLCLSNCLQSVSQVLRRNKNPRRQQTIQDSGPDLNALRNMIMSKCDYKLSSKPRITLTKIPIPNTFIDEMENKPIFKLEAPAELKPALIQDHENSIKTSACYVCRFCEEKFSSTSSLQKHALQNHTFLLFSQRLPKGTTEAQLQLAINITMKKHSVESSSGYVSCKTPFPSADELHAHILKSHWGQLTSAVRNLQSQDSLDDTTTSGEISLGVNTTPDDDKKILFQCSKCEASFNEKDTLERHITLHGLNPPKKTYQDSKTKTSPKKSFPSKANSLQLQCSYCDRKFSNKYNLFRHLKVVHTAISFESQIPSNVSEAELSKVILKFSRWSSKHKRKCKICEKVLHGGTESKLHILNKHLENLNIKLKSMVDDQKHYVK